MEKLNPFDPGLTLPRPQASILIMQWCAWHCVPSKDAPRSLFAQLNLRLGTRQGLTN